MDATHYSQLDQAPFEEGFLYLIGTPDHEDAGL